jgi:hypothetical protein
MTEKDKGAARKVKGWVHLDADGQVIQKLLPRVFGEKGFIPLSASSAEEGLALSATYGGMITHRDSTFPYMSKTGRWGQE